MWGRLPRWNSPSGTTVPPRLVQVDSSMSDGPNSSGPLSHTPPMWPRNAACRNWGVGGQMFGKHRYCAAWASMSDRPDRPDLFQQVCSPHPLQVVNFSTLKCRIFGCDMCRSRSTGAAPARIKAAEWFLEAFEIAKWFRPHGVASREAK